jgi:hypothetical protein
MAFDPLDAGTKLVDVGSERPRVFQLAPRARRPESLVDDHGQRDDPLRAVEPGHHARRDAPVAVPRAERGPGHATRLHGFFERDPALFGGLGGQVLQQAVPPVPGTVGDALGTLVCGPAGVGMGFRPVAGAVAGSAHTVTSTVAVPEWRTLLSDRGLTC